MAKKQKTEPLDYIGATDDDMERDLVRAEINRNFVHELIKQNSGRALSAVTVARIKHGLKEMGESMDDYAMKNAHATVIKNIVRRGEQASEIQRLGKAVKEQARLSGKKIDAARNTKLEPGEQFLKKVQNDDYIYDMYGNLNEIVNMPGNSQGVRDAFGMIERDADSLSNILEDLGVDSANTYQTAMEILGNTPIKYSVGIDNLLPSIPVNSLEEEEEFVLPEPPRGKIKRK